MTNLSPKSSERVLFLGLDVGTQSTKGVLVDPVQGLVVARASRAYGLLEGLPPGAAEQHPETWIEAVRGVAADLFATPGVSRDEVAGVGVSGQQHGLVVLDEAREVVRPAKLWCDTSTAHEADELTRALGRSVPTGFTAPKVRWLARHEPEHWARTAHVLLPHDFVNLRLTGDLAMERGDASGTGWLDPHTREFDARALAETDPGLADKLPVLLDDGELAGGLDAYGAELLGLPEGTAVSAGGGDNMLSAIGSGAVRPGVVVVSLGTSGTAFTWSDAPIVDPEGLIAPFCASMGGWLPLLCVMNLTGVTEEVRALTGLDHAALTAAASAVPVGCEGLSWLPFLSGERVPNLPHATGTLRGLRPGLLRPGHLYRAALEGTSLNLASGLERLRRLGVAVDEVRLVGGAARNPLWRRILAASFGCPVVALAEPESAALGGALQAAWAVARSAGIDAPLEAVVAQSVRFDGAPEAAPADEVARYAELRARFEADVARAYA
ncbi:MAG: xylulokinase [Planctomycetota bacterium]